MRPAFFCPFVSIPSSEAFFLISSSFITNPFREKCTFPEKKETGTSHYIYKKIKSTKIFQKSIKNICLTQYYRGVIKMTAAFRSLAVFAASLSLRLSLGRCAPVKG
jgi:hypothetical protein